MGGEIGIAVYTLIAVWSCLMRWLGNRAQGCLSVCMYVRMDVSGGGLTDGLAQDIKAKEGEGRAVCASSL